MANKKIGLYAVGIIAVVLFLFLFIPGLANWFMGQLGSGSCYDYPYDPDCTCPSEENKTALGWMGGITKYFCDDGWWINPNKTGWEDKARIEGTKKMQDLFPTCTSLPCNETCGEYLINTWGHTQYGDLVVILECRTDHTGGATSWWSGWFIMQTGEPYDPTGMGDYPYCGDCPA